VQLKQQKICLTRRLAGSYFLLRDEQKDKLFVIGDHRFGAGSTNNRVTG
jgi:hypothetical protein